jgi:serine/threonine-protein kinase RIO1
MKDAELSTNKWRELYLQCIGMMRTMYQQCRLVHGDLSEYNILYPPPLLLLYVLLLLLLLLHF